MDYRLIGLLVIAALAIGWIGAANYSVVGPSFASATTPPKITGTVVLVDNPSGPNTFFNSDGGAITLTRSTMSLELESYPLALPGTDCNVSITGCNDFSPFRQCGVGQTAIYNIGIKLDSSAFQTSTNTVPLTSTEFITLCKNASFADITNAADNLHTITVQRTNTNGACNNAIAANMVRLVASYVCQAN